jgi:hypothetical protein
MEHTHTNYLMCESYQLRSHESHKFWERQIGEWISTAAQMHGLDCQPFLVTQPASGLFIE